MAKIKITKRTVEALKVAAKDYIAFDTDLPGFGVRVMPSGKRFFLVQYRRHGRTRAGDDWAIWDRHCGVGATRSDDQTR
jgi:hypothetical protein